MDENRCYHCGYGSVYDSTDGVSINTHHTSETGYDVN